MAKNEGKKKVKSKKKRRIVWLSILGVIVLLCLGAYAYVHQILNNPGAFFTVSVTAAPDEESANKTVAPAIELPSRTPAADSTPAPAEATEAPAATTAQTQAAKANIVNIALFGIDAYEDGDTTSGTMPHTDVCMVIAVNFDENRVDIISLPRDTFTTAPGHKGFYKLNGVFNVGGGMADTDGGFALQCKSAEEWLGGISVSYYYAVDFQAVIDVVDAIGGIDFQLDETVTDGSDRELTPGYRHMDGVAVLAYLRTRKGASTGPQDRDRTARQRKMLVAIFTKLKTEGKLSMVPDLISAANSGIYTNTNLSQTVALANYALNIDPEAIGTHVMDGQIHMTYDWAFSFTDQQGRIDLLREIYGIEAEPIGLCSVVYEKWLHTEGFQLIKYLAQAEKTLTFANESIGSAAALTAEQRLAYQSCWFAYEDLNALYEQTSAWYANEYATPINSADKKEAAVAFSTAVREQEAALKTAVLALAEAFNDTQKLRWTVSDTWYEDADINDVYVDFR